MNDEVREIVERLREQQLQLARLLEYERADVAWFATPECAQTCTVHIVDEKAIARLLLFREKLNEGVVPRKQVQKANEDHDRKTRTA